MGSQLPYLAAAVIALGGGVAFADPTTDLLKQGAELYKAGKYAEAVPVFRQAFDLDHKPDTLFSLAQAERLSGDCKSAAPHYHQVIERVNDFNVAKLVEHNLTLCEASEPAPPPREVKPEPVAPPPKVITNTVTKTVVREVHRTDRAALALIAGGTLALGGAGGLYLAATANRDAADSARTLGEHDRLFDRASTEQIATFIAGGVGVALIAAAAVHWIVAKDDDAAHTDVAIVPATDGGGGMVWLSTRW